MDKRTILVDIQNAVPRLPELCFKDLVNWTIETGQQWAVIGPNGAGKTMLADLLQGKYALKAGSIEWGIEGATSQLVQGIAFRDIYSLVDCRNTYYQQRWHSTETEEFPTVAEILRPYLDTDYFVQLATLLGVTEFLPKKLIFLSSGELRKLLIVRTLLKQPRLLILDNPFIGLDASSRMLLTEMLQQLTLLKGVQVVLLLANPADIPEMVTHVLPLKSCRCLPVQKRDAFLQNKELIAELFPSEREECHSSQEIVEFPITDRKPATHCVTFRMDQVSVSYGDRTILKSIDWEVKNGEKWALLGPNGSGKSTLLSLIYADNPQSYANTLYLFDRKRGSGESIWDIKKRIGYVSPEMHLYYLENVPVLKVVTSGFFDTIGLYRKCTKEQEESALAWMRLFGIESLKNRSFHTLSSGEQRLVLLTRSFVKDPDLIILDEPLHGLDVSNKKRAVTLIEQFCSRPGKTLVYVTHYPDELPACVDKSFNLVKQL